MKRNDLLDFVREAVKAAPNVKAYLSNKARFTLYEPAAYKSSEYMLDQITGLVTSLYNNQIGGEFIDVMANVISGQLYDAYSKAWFDYGETGALPAYLEEAYQAAVVQQYEFVDAYFRNIIDARIDQTGLAPLLMRANMWANQWNASNKRAKELIDLENGGNLEWIKGQTEKGCKTCADLDGKVMSAREWEALDLHPRGYPNSKLDCEGGGPANNCDCTLSPTDKKRSPGAYGRIEELLMSR